MAKGKGIGKGKKGLGGAKRHRKILRDNLQGMKNPMIQRMGRRAGIMRMEANVYEEVRMIIHSYLQNILMYAITLVQHQRMKTVQFNHVQLGYQMATGNHFMGGAHTVSREAPKVHQHNKKTVTAAAGGKPHRFRPGTVALGDIRFYQKHSEHALIPFVPFDRLCRETAQDYEVDLRFEENVIFVLRFMVEQYIVDLLHQANEIAIHSGRLSVSAKDIQMVRKIRGERY